MTARMANFIGIHRMQSLNSPASRQEPNPEVREGASRIQDNLALKMPFHVDSEEMENILKSGTDEER